MSAEDHGERLARIETKIDALLARDADHEARLRAVEKKQWAHSGGVALISLYLTKFGFALPH